MFEFDGRSLRALFGARSRLFIIGAGHSSRAAAQVALALVAEIVAVKNDMLLTQQKGGSAVPGMRAVSPASLPQPLLAA